jgi:hypothetical protein
VATQLFKKNGQGGYEATWAQAERVASMLANGWAVSREAFDNAKVDAPEIKAPTKEEADTNKTGKLSNQEVREAAKKAGIEGWETTRIKNLKRLLGY